MGKQVLKRDILVISKQVVQKCQIYIQIARIKILVKRILII